MVLNGALVRIYINDREYGTAQQIQYTIEYGESSIYGIDSGWPQEISSSRCAVAGSISGLRMQGSLGPQGFQATSLYRDIQSAPYISIRISDRVSGEDILTIPYAKIKAESTTIGIKNTVKTSLSFEGLMPIQPLDKA
jgi:hypothetical protein